MRDAYTDQLDSIRDDLLAMARLVREAVMAGTSALLEGDAQRAEQVISGDAEVDALREKLEERSFELLSLQNPVAGDLRMLVASLRMVSEFERMGDLAVHVAKVARMRFPDPAVPQEVRPLFLEAGHIAENLVSKTATVIAKLDVEAAAQLEAEDDLMDQVHRQLFRELLSDSWPHGMEQAIDVTLLGRYYERFADHAVSVARRVVYLVTGEMEMRSSV